jgi:sialidase-1
MNTFIRWKYGWLLIGCMYTKTLTAQTEPVAVFIAGTEGYQSFRIPAIVSISHKSILAFCEGRVNAAADFGDINIVMKSSKDQGRTWSDLKVIVDNKTLQAGNPAPVFDALDPAYPNGRIFLFYNTGNNHESEIRKGKGMREVWYTCSVDAGEHWSEPVNITLWVHRPLQPSLNNNYRFEEDWRSYANTPGHAFQFQSGTYKGRLYVAANHSAGPPQKSFEDYQSHGFFSDDHGKTFHLTASLPLPGSNEATAAQLSANRLLLNARNQREI